MRLFDTRTGQVSDLHLGREVRLYVCGITPYDATHLGHAFTYTVFDALVRFLEHQGHRVRYARNITDVDDDILAKARERGLDYRELARREVARFDADLSALGLRRPDAEPRATAFAPAIAEAVGRLVANGSAYALDDGRVYFDVASAPEFGQLSGLSREEMLPRFADNGGDPDAPGKRDPLDFLLWQPSAADEPSWPGPFGPGRPGWHIECSVMAQSELGPTLDLHGGGKDLIFPHHEAEIVQAEHLTGQPFTRAWAHVGMVGMDGEKMAKSVGNLVFLADLLDHVDGATLRRYLLSHHYRSSWSHDEERLTEAAGATKLWRDAADSTGVDEELAARFHAAMVDDLDTPAAITVLDQAARSGAGTTLRELAAVLGFDLG